MCFLFSLREGTVNVSNIFKLEIFKRDLLCFIYCLTMVDNI